MRREDILASLNTIFKEVLHRNDIVLNEQMSAKDIAEWDSLSHMIIISNIEKEWNIHFKIREIIKMRNVGDMVDTIISQKA
ncbi:MAG: acyl carrier protein [Prevotella sp.]